MSRRPARQETAGENRLRNAADVDAVILKIELLGGFRAVVRERELGARDWRSRRASRVVKLLALAPGHALHREQLCDQLWPEADPEDAANNLRQALHIARRTLRALPLSADQLLRSQDERIYLYPTERLWIDAEDFESAARAAHSATDPAVYWSAIERYSGALLPDDPYEDWAAARRESLASRYVSLLERVAGLHEERGEYPQAIAALRRLVAAEPASEAGHVRLMGLYARTGQRPLALRQYQRLADALARELDLAPEPATQELARAIAHGRFPRRPGDAAPIARSATPKTPPLTNLPHPLTSFVGREQEVDQIDRWLRNHRLVTLTGPGGMGKTRLALEAARRLVEHYPDGVWLVELAALADPALVPQAVADVLGIQIEGSHSPAATLIAALRDQAMLLVLDNCEHLIAACAELAGMLLGACPAIHVLATSREALGLPGEHRWPVPSLPLPPAESGLAVVAESEAVRLFVDRIRWHRPGFALTSENAGHVAAICRRLDGLPLALELAAARAAVLALPELAARLDDALGVLAGAGRRVPTRQQTLRTTLDWSYNLLTPPEQTLFRRLAIFAGGWTLAAAEGICPAGALAEPELLETLEHLMAKSLVQVDLNADQARYGLLEPVRQYATDLLTASGEADDLRERHAAYFIAFLEEIEPALVESRQASWLTQVDREHDNLRGALRWTLERGLPDVALQLGGMLWHYWELRWHSAEGLAWLQAALALPGGPRDAWRARAALGAGELARRILDFPRSAALLREALEIQRELGDADGIAWSLVYLAYTLGMAGDFEGARAPAEESLALFRASGDQLGVARALNTLAEDARLRGDYGVAAAYYREALTIDRQLGDPHGSAIRLHNLGYVALHEGDVRQAVRAFRESHQLHQALGYRSGPLSFLEGMAASASAAGAAEQAARLYGAWEANCRLPGTEFTLHPPDQREYDRYVARARDALGGQALAHAWESGRHLTLEQAVAEALAFAETLDQPARLTARERQVAALAAHGLTNHQIALKLDIAERTVDAHVAHILRKLALSSRRQLAARLTGSDPEPFAC